MAKKNGGKLRAAKSLKSQNSPRIAVNHNETVLRA